MKKAVTVFALSAVASLLLFTGCGQGSGAIKESLSETVASEEKSSETVADVDTLDEVQVKTKTGVLNGYVSENGIETFLGIPYAQAPVGNLRWKAPVSLEESDKEIDAKHFGYTCPQVYDEAETASMNEQSEDCLTLNVWASDTKKKKQPVMVFIHGGGYYEGGTDVEGYHGDDLAASGDVIVVTINYRLGIFGFMNFGGVDSEYKESGYLGTMDQVKALEWIHDNIENFGGDPENVTIFGESAGSASVSLLSVVPAAKGLFQKVIAESGNATMYNAPEYSEAKAEEFMQDAGCATMEEMQALSVEQLKQAFDKFYEKYPYEMEALFCPTADGSYIPEKPMQAYKNGDAKDIKLLIGTNKDEYNYWRLYFEDIEQSCSEFHKAVVPILFDNQLNLPDVEDVWKHTYNSGDSGQIYLDFMTNLDWSIPSELMCEYQSKYNDAYLYQFGYESPIEGMGSCHAIELGFVFGKLKGDSLLGDNAPQHLSDEMQAAWINFAATGNPNGEGVPGEWKKYTADDRETMQMDETQWISVKDLNGKNVNLLRGAIEKSLLSE